MGAKYNSLEEIKADLKKYKLEQEIALEELKLVKNNIQENVKPVKFIGRVFYNYFSIPLIYKIIKKII